MSTRNTDRSFGLVTRVFHWLTALLILSAIPLGWIANRLPYDTAEALASKAQLFSVHKTIGVAAFLVALARILWALTETRPAPLHPDRMGELRLAQTVHWLLYISLLAVPLTGWIHHAAVTGFAPILWPLGQGLPFVPQSETVAHLASSLHWVFTKLLVIAVILHVVGAIKHHVVDRDSTLRRMTRGVPAPMHPEHARSSALPLMFALGLYALGAGLAWSWQSDETQTALPEATTAADTASTATAAAEPASAGTWAVSEGTLGFTIRQMGQDVTGRFANWTADITFDETPTEGRHGKVRVVIDTGSLSVGSVSDQAKGKDFFDTATFPQAVFTADILPAEGGTYVADGTLDLRGVQVPVVLPFTLALDGNVATMQGSTTLDRRDFGMGQTYGDEATIGFGANVTVSLTATRP